MESRLTVEKAAPRMARPPDAERRRRFAGTAVVLAAAAIAVGPQLVRGNSCGHDFDVHLVSWLDCLHAWRHGIAYPHWTPSANWDAGEPRFVFYPPLTWMAGAALGLVFGWHWAPIVLTFLCLAGTGLAVRALALETLSDAAATLAGCAALFSGFTLFTAYERSAFPEFTGGVWLPLLLLFALRDKTPAATGLRRALDGSTVPLALALAACWLSNAPLGVIGSYLLAAVALLAAVLKKSWAPALRAAVAAVLGLGIAAFYWIPAAWEQRWVDIRQATQDPGYDFENNWLFAHHANPLLALHDEVLHTASWISISMIAVALASLAIAARRGTLAAGQRTGWRQWWAPLAAIPCVVLFLLFPISRPLWELLPRIKFLQYPWRWMEAVEAPMAIFFAAAVWPSGRRARQALAGVCAAAFLGATTYAATQFFQVCYPEDAVPAVLADYHAGAGFEGMYEYEPPQADITEIAMGLPDACLVSDPRTALGRVDSDTGNLTWTASQGSCLRTFAIAGGRGNPEHLSLRADVPQAGFLVLRLLTYPAWTATVNGEPAAPLPRRDDGLLALPVPRGAVDLQIDWTTTPDVRLSRWVSLLGVLALTGVGLLERKMRRSQVS